MNNDETYTEYLCRTVPGYADALREDNEVCAQYRQLVARTKTLVEIRGFYYVKEARLLEVAEDQARPGHEKEWFQLSVAPEEHDRLRRNLQTAPWGTE